MREMRRKDREVTENEARSLLAKSEFGVLSTISDNGKPYGVPLNYCVLDNCIYFHCAVEGRKIDNILQNKFVSFCVVGETEVLPGEFGIKFESVIVSGEIEEIFTLNKKNALEVLLQKYSPEFLIEGMKYIEALNSRTRVFKIIINEMSGKARK